MSTTGGFSQVCLDASITIHAYQHTDPAAGITDDVPFYGNAGDAYHSYGIDPHYGAVIVIRPDQYVANVVPPNKDGITELERFFQGFLVVQEKIYSEKTTIS